MAKVLLREFGIIEKEVLLGCIDVKKNSIYTQFTVALLLVFIVGSVLGGIALWSVLLRHAENEITARINYD